ncbi:MAG TPA: hypothetical protein VNI02_24625 [Blastocatellia bacterium]|nr:hypothetical protein [Blastocatellia bacterium]
MPAIAWRKSDGREGNKRAEKARRREEFYIALRAASHVYGSVADPSRRQVAWRPTLIKRLIGVERCGRATRAR